MRGGNLMVPVTMEVDDRRIRFDFPFNLKLKDEIKQMAGHKYHGYDDVNPKKIWSAKNCIRNWFQIQYLMGKDPYKRYEESLIDLPPTGRPLFDNQKVMVQFGLTRKQCMFACEMGLGKTLAAIEVMENSGTTDWLWIGPRSALAAARIEMSKWGCKVQPILMTYEGLRNAVQADDVWIPKGIIFDESSKIKTHTAQRSQAASIVVEEMRKKYGTNCYIILMTGSPAPRNPGDWWHQLEVACPGFIKEGEYFKFRRRLSITVERESPSSGKTFPELVTWLDDERKCNICGQVPEEHTDPLVSQHAWTPSINEVKDLYGRMEGLVITQFKKDCLDLPEMHYVRHTLEPSKSTLRKLSLIKSQASRTITALILIRELSDGFQYIDTVSDEETVKCTRCEGTGKAKEYELEDNKIKRELIIDCPNCKATGKIPKEIRKTVEVDCPKERLLADLLDEHESIGRFVVYAGFRASVDRVCKVALKYKWDVVRVDGRGWMYLTGDGTFEQPVTPEEMLNTFQNKDVNRKIAFVGQPGAAGMGITLTASPSLFCWSNTFNAEDRIQIMARIHRPGMDLNLGAKVIDVIHLPVDEYILDNLDNKIDLQNLSLGKLKEHM